MPTLPPIPRGRPRGSIKPTPKEFENRFIKHYYKHQSVILQSRRSLYQQRRAMRVCVRCGEKLMPKSNLFCKEHLQYKSVLDELITKAVH